MNRGSTSITNDELIDLLIQVSDEYNPYLVDIDPRTLYYAGADVLSEVEKLTNHHQNQYIDAIVRYMWDPIMCVD